MQTAFRISEAGEGADSSGWKAVAFGRWILSGPDDLAAAGTGRQSKNAHAGCDTGRRPGRRKSLEGTGDRRRLDEPVSRRIVRWRITEILYCKGIGKRNEIPVGG